MKYWTDQGYSAASVRVCPSQEGPMGQLFQVTTTTEFAKHFDEEIEQLYG